MPLTLSAEDFKKKYGQAGLDKFAPVSEPSMMENIGAGLKERGGQLVETFRQTASGKINPLETGIQTVGTGVGAVTDIFGELLAPVLKPALEPILSTSGGQSAVKALQGGIESYNSWKNSSPTNKRIGKDLESVINIASIFPVGKAAQTTAKVATKTAGKIAIGAEFISKSSKPLVKKGLEKGSELAYSTAIPLSDVEAGALQAYKAGYGKKPLLPAETAATAGFAGTESQIGVQSAKTANNLWKKTVRPALEVVPGEVNTKTAINNAENKLLSGIKNPSRINELKEAFAALRDDWKEIPSMSHELSQDVKSELYKVLPDKTWKGKPIGSAFKEAQASLAEELRSQTRKAIEISGLPNVKEVLSAFDNYGNYKALMAFGRKAMTGGKFKGGLGSWLNAAKETVTVPILTTGGKLLKSAAKKLQ